MVSGDIKNFDVRAKTKGHPSVEVNIMLIIHNNNNRNCWRLSLYFLACLFCPCDMHSVALTHVKKCNPIVVVSSYWDPYQKLTPIYIGPNLVLIHLSGEKKERWSNRLFDFSYGEKSPFSRFTGYICWIRSLIWCDPPPIHAVCHAVLSDNMLL